MRLPTLILCAVSFAFVSTALVGAQALSRELRTKIISAVVRVQPFDESASQFLPGGSGTIVSPDGYVLTNFHVVGDTRTEVYHKWSRVAITNPGSEDDVPKPTYLAKFVDGDPTTDLAVLLIEFEFRGKSPVRTSTIFPFVTVDESDDLMASDWIYIFGYPSVSGLTITVSAGIMGGWLGEDKASGGRAWIKTDAKIDHGNSGGAAVNDHGRLIGVPTAIKDVKYSDLDREEQAYLRPIRLALPLILPYVPVHGSDSSPAVSSRDIDLAQTSLEPEPINCALRLQIVRGITNFDARSETIKGAVEDILDRPDIRDAITCAHTLAKSIPRFDIRSDVLQTVSTKYVKLGECESATKVANNIPRFKARDDQLAYVSKKCNL